MGHVHFQTIENDFGIFVLAIVFVAAANFDGVHFAGRNVHRKSKVYEVGALLKTLVDSLFT